MNITKANIHDLPRDWAYEIADGYVRDLPKYAHMLEVQGPYAILEEMWPDCRDDVEEMLASMIEMEQHYEQQS